MEDKKNFNLLANQFVSLVDFVKWTSSFSNGVIQQMELPISGMKLSPSVSSLFALAKDDLGWMLVMHEREASWLAELPIAAGYVGFNDGLILVTERITIFEQAFEPVGVQLFVPHIFLRAELAAHKLLGFGLLRESADSVERVNRLVPLYNPSRYEERRVQSVRKQPTGLFSQQ